MFRVLWFFIAGFFYVGVFPSVPWGTFIILSIVFWGVLIFGDFQGNNAKIGGY